MNPYKNLALWLVIFLMVAMLWQLFQSPQKGSKPISYSEFLSLVENGNVMEVTIQGDNLSGKAAPPQEAFKTFAPRDPELI